MKHVAFDDEENKPLSDDELSGDETDTPKEAEFDKSKPPVLQSSFAKTKAAMEALAGADDMLTGDKFFGCEGASHALPMKKLRCTCYVYTDWKYIGYGEWTIGSPFCYLGRGTHPATGEDCQVIEYEDTRGNVRRLIIPFPLIAKGGADLIGYLSANGFKVGTEPKAKALTQEMLNELRGPHIDIRDRLGWVPGTLQFAYKDHAIGAANSSQVVFDTAAFRHIKTGKRGTFEGWREGVGKTLRGNRRPIFMHALMLASPFARFAPQSDPFTGNLRGDTTDGKSTEAYCAGAIHGGGDGKSGFMHTWDGTAGATQAIAAAHTDIGVIFDEVSQAGEQGQRSAYAIHNGAGRNRLNRDASLRRSDETRTFVLSTGETDLFEMAGLKGKAPTYGGLDARTVNIPSDAGCGLGIYENLHGFPRTKEGARRLANQRKLAASLNYGHVGPKVITGIIDECNEVGEEAFRRKLAKIIEAFVVGLDLPDDCDAAVRRVASSFGLICAAGQFACRWDVLPLNEDEIIDAVSVCFKAWIADRGGTKAKTTATALIVLRDYILKNIGRFIPVSDAATTTAPTVAGYRDREAFYVLPPTWREVMQSAPRAKLAEELNRLKLLIRQPSSKGDQFAKKVGGLYIKCYAVSGRILSLGDDGALSEEGGDAGDDDESDNVVCINARRLKTTIRQTARQSLH